MKKFYSWYKKHITADFLQSHVCGCKITAGGVDSLSSDIKGASAVGINAIWINRSKREIPNGVTAVENLLEVYNTDYFN